ncbi:uncharacterized protein [Haliotis asinina]|uniref:uncharacterized protein n=1 Tax=Haliotis asinina TaxID=109174 RepID=UPI003531A246
MSASAAGALTQTAFILLVCYKVQCFGVINHHFITDGRNITFPNFKVTRVCHSHKLRCFLHCAQDAGCGHVGVFAAGEVVLLEEPITPSPDESVTEGFLYTRVSGFTTQKRFATNNVSSALSPISTSQETLGTTETLSTKIKRPASPSTATSHSRMMSTGIEDRKPDTTKSKASKHLNIENTGTEERKTDTNQSKATKHSNTADSRTSKDRPTAAGEAYIATAYTIVTQTGTEKDSGTDCYVHLDLYGQQGLMDSLYLNNEGVDEMADGANDTFVFIRSIDLGNITQMVLRVAEFGIGPGWLLIGVDVRRKRNYERHTITETFHSYINKWFQRLDGLHFFDRGEEKYNMPYKLVSTVTTEQSNTLQSTIVREFS